MPDAPDLPDPPDVPALCRKLLENRAALAATKGAIRAGMVNQSTPLFANGDAPSRIPLNPGRHAELTREKDRLEAAHAKLLDALGAATPSTRDGALALARGIHDLVRPSTRKEIADALHARGVIGKRFAAALTGDMGMRPDPRMVIADALERLTLIADELPDPDAVDILDAVPPPPRNMGDRWPFAGIRDAMRTVITRWTPTEEDTAPEAPSIEESDRRRTSPGEAGQKLEAALVAWHEYDPAGENGSVGNWDPVGCNQLAGMADVSSGAASQFFKDRFVGHDQYKARCNMRDILTALKHMAEPAPPPKRNIPLPEER